MKILKDLSGLKNVLASDQVDTEHYNKAGQLIQGKISFVENKPKLYTSLALFSIPTSNKRAKYYIKLSILEEV